jgi:hypothetical protein
VARFQLAPGYFGVVELAGTHQTQGLAHRVVLGVQWDEGPKPGHQNPTQTANPQEKNLYLQHPKSS